MHTLGDMVGMVKMRSQLLGRQPDFALVIQPHESNLSTFAKILGLFCQVRD
jgi:hypothetical protein